MEMLPLSPASVWEAGPAPSSSPQAVMTRANATTVVAAIAMPCRVMAARLAALAAHLVTAL
jgi:hypothetical protein